MNGEPRVTVIIVNWNGRRYLPQCLAALARSSVSVRVVLVDNASTDGSVRYVRAEHPQVELIASGENLGYAAGANAGLRVSFGPYVMIMNPDVILAPNHLAILSRKMDVEPEIGAAQGKLYQIRPNDYLLGRISAATTLDSAGHAIRRSRMVVDIGQGEPDRPEFSEERSVFSACGAAMFLRRAALDDLAVDGEYFDEAFFAYKEDIDLCWRARLLGWDIRYVPAAVGYHVRGWAGSRPPPLKSMPVSARRHSWKNHYLLILKNDTAGEALKALPFLAGWELLRQGHALLRDRAVYAAYRDLKRLVARALSHRAKIMRRRRVGPRTMRRWFGAHAGFSPLRSVVPAVLPNNDSPPIAK